MNKGSYLKSIPFSQFILWDVKRYNYTFERTFENAIYLKDILIPYIVKVTKNEIIKNGWRIILKINFQGELFLRDINQIDTYKGNLNKVPENSIIYSKINVRHGCLYYHEKGEKPFAVSNEYPTFIFKSNNVNGNYLKLVLRSEVFKKLLNTKTSGISKARVKVKEFLGIKIPLPSVSVQNRIVEAYNAKIILAEELEKRPLEIEKRIEGYLSVELGVKNKTRKNKSGGLQLISFKELNRWALSHVFKDQQFSLTKAKYSIYPIRSLITFFEGGKTPSTSRKDFWGGDIFWTSAKDMKELFLTNVQDKITEKGVKEAGMKIYPIGTILGVFRSGILRHSFPVALTKIETTINQDLKAIGVDESIINKEYFLYYLKTFQKLILERSQKFGVTVESINTDEFLEIPVILPSISIQNDIVKTISKMKGEIEEGKKKADEIRQQAIKEFENEIFHLCD